MMTNSVVPMKTKVVEDSSRRRSHGGSAWQLSPNLVQPQDGAASGVDVKARVAVLSAKLPSAMPFEGEDAGLTGSTRNLFRRLLGLNVGRGMEPLKPVTALTIRKPLRTVAMGEQKVA